MQKISSMRKITPFFIVLFLVSTLHAQPRVGIETLRKDLYFLASDSLKGRFPGTAEDKIAAEYIAQAFRQAGLNFFTPDGKSAFQIVTAVETTDSNKLSIGSVQAVYGEDYSIYAFSRSGYFKSEIVFAGFGMNIQTDSLIHNDYEGLDVQGKWVLALKGDPEPENNSSPYIPFADARNKALFAQDQGAIGLILIGGTKNNPNDELTPLLFERSIASAGIAVVDMKKSFAETQLFANKILIDSLESQLIRNENPQISFTDIEPEAVIDLQKKLTTTFNIYGYLEGSDPVLKHEFLVIGAHYDHLGMGGEGSGSRVPDTIAAHVGADDNASGTAALLELAKRFSQPKQELRRSVLFVSFGAEELGLLGSKHFVDNLPVDRSKITAMINMDMIGRLNEEKAVAVGGTGTAKNFEDMLRELESNSELKLSFSPEGFGASDHASFYAADIPVLFFTTGAHPEYHTPADTPDKINYDGMMILLELIEETAVRLANIDERPIFTEAGPKQRFQARRGFKVTLGIMPSYTAGDIQGLGVDAVTKGGPADMAGMKKGDIIVGINGMEVNNIYDYMNRLRQLKQGQRIHVDILRKEKPEILIVDL